MASRIPQQFIDDLVSRTDIVDVIESRGVQLRKKGKDYMACCPFHQEKTPSFSVSQEKQFYYCFGCGAKGTVLGFLMDFDHMSFVEAVKELASHAGLEVPEQEMTPQQREALSENQKIYELLAECDQYYRRQLREHPQAQRAVDYLKQRGLSGEIAAAYGIGFAPPGWDNLLNTYGKDVAGQQRLTSAGMLIRKDDGKVYDRFRDRIMFPIIDRRGRTIGFGGRVMGDDEPKYLNSPETPVFHKGRELYGLYQAQKALRHIDRLLVVEGYMDVVALAQFGIRYAVATLGTATTREHLELLFRTTEEIVFCFDGDRAGRDAAWRAVETLMPVMRDGRQVGFVFLSEGEDPDSTIRSRGKDAFEALVNNAIPLSKIFFEHLGASADIGSIDGRARMVKLARPLLERLPAGVFHDMMTARLAEITHMEADQLSAHLQQPSSPPPARGQRQQAVKQPMARRHDMSTMQQAIGLLLHRPDLARRIADPGELARTGIRGVEYLVQMLDLLRENPHLTTSALLEHWREQELGNYLGKLVQKEFLLDEGDPEAEFDDVIKLLLKQGQQIAALKTRADSEDEMKQKFIKDLEVLRKDPKHQLKQ